MAGVALSCEQRDEIASCLGGDELMSWVAGAARVGVDRTTVAREVVRNGGRSRYRAAVAQRRADRCRARPKDPILVADPVLNALVTAELVNKQSPEVIARSLAKLGGVRVCTETIYRAVYARELAVRSTECLRRRRPKRRRRRDRHESKRAGLPNIATRPASIGDRSEPGHWEGDLIVGKGNQSAVLTLLERVTRFNMIIDLPNGYRADERGRIRSLFLKSAFALAEYRRPTYKELAIHCTRRPCRCIVILIDCSRDHRVSSILALATTGSSSTRIPSRCAPRRRSSVQEPTIRRRSGRSLANCSMHCFSLSRP